MKASTVLEGLLAVKEAVLADVKPKWFVARSGICNNLDEYEIKKEGSPEAYSSDCLADFFSGWPEWSGCKIFPVPSMSYEHTSESVYLSHMAKQMWTGEYGAARLRLLDYLIRRVEELGDSEIGFGEK